ncbi:MAG TPA: hypothetical protein VK973_18175 [Arenicellales bacterium]|nr:hypothetical protein [Arenicellales bacterium]
MKVRIYTWCAIGICVALAAGCAAVRKVTYPPDFVYLDRAEITGSMSRLSADIWRIEDILSSSETVLPYEREEIITILGDMRQVADNLGAGTVDTNHPFIDENIDAFRQDVQRALDDVKAEPPSYYRAGVLSGRCLACHRLRS